MSQARKRAEQLVQQALSGHRTLPWENEPNTRPAVGLSANTQQHVPAVFKPITIRNIHMKNRIMVSPMCMYSAADGHLNDFHVAHLGSFAIHGAAAIMIEATAVQANGRISQYDSGLWQDSQIEPIKRIVKLCHSQQAVCGIQLAHAGRKASTPPPFFLARGDNRTTTTEDELGWPNDVIGPSKIPFDHDWIVPREMSKQEIKDQIQAWIDATKRAEQAGVDFIEIHSAHGYLFSEFLSPLSNQRTDEYGGSIENRARILLDTIRAVRGVWDKCLLVRISCDEFVQGGWSKEDSVWLAGQIKDAGADMIDCSAGGNNAKQQFPPLLEGYQVPYAEAIKKAYPDFIVGAVGMITDSHFANSIIEEGKADIVLVAREFLRDPHLVIRWANELGYQITYAPEYQRSKPSSKTTKHQQIKTVSQTENVNTKQS